MSGFHLFSIDELVCFSAFRRISVTDVLATHRTGSPDPASDAPETCDTWGCSRR